MLQSKFPIWQRLVPVFLVMVFGLVLPQSECAAAQKATSIKAHSEIPDPQQFRQNILNEEIKLAEGGSSEHMVTVGLHYYSGDLGILDYEKAAKWFFRAASVNDADGVFMLAKIYHEGKGVKRDDKQAFELATKAVSLTNKGGPKFYLGRMYLHGLGTKKDIVKGCYWLKAAGMDDVVAYKEEMDAACSKKSK